MNYNKHKNMHTGWLRKSRPPAICCSLSKLLEKGDVKEGKEERQIPLKI
jgi:hypothetical protein